jgi:hypothetical protein
MGSWGAGIFDDDLAVDVKNAFERELDSGASAEGATRKVLERFARALKDYDDGPVVYLALAALQLQHNSLLPVIKEKALDIISSGQALRGWDEGPADSPDLVERKQVLKELHAKLTQGDI